MNGLMPPPKNKVGIDPQIAQTKIPWEEIAKHDNENDCWIVLNNIVLDVTDYLGSHPGKIQPIMIRAGKDATASFQAMYHSQKASNKTIELAIGVVDPQSKPLPGQIDV